MTGDKPYYPLYEELSDNIDTDRSQNNSAARGLVEFKNVYFRYPQRKEYLFEGLSFTVKPKQRVAIVGQSGTGKTTLADLLFNIYYPEQGEILVDKMSTITYSKKNIFPRFAIVSQEPALFNRSVKDNIQYNLDCTLGNVK